MLIHLYGSRYATSPSRIFFQRSTGGDSFVMIVVLVRIIAALKESGIYENSTVVALGDHSALDESKAVKLNVLLRKNGLIQC